MVPDLLIEGPQPDIMLRNRWYEAGGKVDIRLHGKGNSNFHGARPVYLDYLDDKVDSD